MSSTPGAQVRVFEDIESLSRAAMELTVSLSQKVVASAGRAAIALSGGSTPKQLYALLGSAPGRDAVPWPHMHFFWADERCVPKDHPESNFKLAYDSFLSDMPLPAENIHRIKGELGPSRAARLYEDDMRNFFNGVDIPAFDIILLGVGQDGHTASLFPGSSALRETTRLALPVYLKRPKRDRVTLSLPVLNHAASVLFLAPGSAKAEAVSAILEGDIAHRYPAGLVQPLRGQVTWFLDHESAGKLRAPVRDQWTFTPS